MAGSTAGIEFIRLFHFQAKVEVTGNKFWFLSKYTDGPDTRPVSVVPFVRWMAGHDVIMGGQRKAGRVSQ